MGADFAGFGEADFGEADMPRMWAARDPMATPCGRRSAPTNSLFGGLQRERWLGYGSRRVLGREPEPLRPLEQEVQERVARRPEQHERADHADRSHHQRHGAD